MHKKCTANGSMTNKNQVHVFKKILNIFSTKKKNIEVRTIYKNFNWSNHHHVKKYTFLPPIIHQCPQRIVIFKNVLNT